MHKTTKILIAGMTLLFAASAGLAQDGTAKPGKEKAAAREKHAGANGAGRANREARGEPQWRLAVMSYTYNKLTVTETIDKTQKLGSHFLEGFSWQKVSPEHGDMQFNEQMPEAAMQEVKKKLADAKVRLANYYAQKVGDDEAKTRKIFEFCKKMGIETVICEPDPKHLPLIDKLAEELKVKVAIHNHPKDPKHPDYTNWNPDNVMKMMEGRSKWIGCCADNGHWARSGLDGVECLKKYQGRLISLHLKDVDKLGPGAKDVPYGTGKVDLKALLEELKRQNFAGVFSIEYESEKPDATADVAQCIEWFRKAKRSLGVK